MSFKNKLCFHLIYIGRLTKIHKKSFCLINTVYVQIQCRTNRDLYGGGDNIQYLFYKHLFYDNVSIRGSNHANKNPIKFSGSDGRSTSSLN